MAAARTLVVGVDFSDFSKRALQLAAALAVDLEAKVVVVHAFPGTQMASALGGGMGTTAVPPPQAEFQGDVELDEALELTEEWAQPLRAQGIEVAVEAKPGHAAPLILDAATRHKAFLVVAGTHGRTGWRRIGLGSVAQELVRKSPVPVLVVPQPGA